MPIKKVREINLHLLPTRPKHCIAVFIGEISCRCFVADLDDAHGYSAHAKPHSSPLDFSINAFYFLPSSLHAVSVSRVLPCPVSSMPVMIDSAQFEDAEL